MSDNRSSDESMWECHTAGGDLGTDGFSRGDTPALLNSLEQLAGVESNGIDGRGGERGTLMEDRGTSELEEGRSPVEEAGQEVEGIDHEELCSMVEEGEEAALALDVLPSESDLPCLPMDQASVDHSEAGHQCWETQDNVPDNVPEHVKASISVPEDQATEVSSTVVWDIHCRSAQSDTCHSDNLA